MDRRSPVSVTASTQMCQPTPGRFPSGKLSGTDRILNVGFWIPLDAMEGIRGLIADLGVGHSDLPPSNHLQNLVKLIAGDAIRLPTSCGSQPVHAIEPYGLDDAGPDHPVPTGHRTTKSRVPVHSRIIGSTTTPALWSPRPASSTSPAGCGGPSGSTGHGGMRTFRRW
jgi:hypothetical protein